ncbi:MAG: 3-hydroxyacyl-ACP dehydratase FabZ family protein [Phycisphaerales bacterium]
MRFILVDRVLERSPDRIVTVKHVSMAEEYMDDHFKSFPVLPGVMMLEALVQAARELLGARADGRPMVLGRARAFKYGRFVQPGSSLRVEVDLLSRGDDGSADFRGEGTLVEPGGDTSKGDGPVAVAGRFSLRPARIAESRLVKPLA